MSTITRTVSVCTGCSKSLANPSRIRRLQHVSRRHSSHVIRDGRPFRVAILGSGPAGFYTAYKVMSSIENAIIDMYECLPVPFGLVRYGVAPDHPEVRVKMLFSRHLYFSIFLDASYASLSSSNHSFPEMPRQV